MKQLKIALIAIATLCLSQIANSQNPQRFQQDIKKFAEKDKSVNHQGKILFVGSSSVRFWTSLQNDFPNHQVFNRGFGGSQMSDLLYYIDDLILKYKAKQVFIYEGDNDINDGESSKSIMNETKVLLQKIHKALPKTKVVFISAKPSISRWKLKAQYEEFNSKLKAFTEKHNFVEYVDVWTPMLNKKGEPIKNIFIEDDLHMNARGYKIWKETIKPYLLKE